MLNDLSILHKHTVVSRRRSKYHLASLCLALLLLTPVTQAATLSGDKAMDTDASRYDFHATLAENKIHSVAYCDNYLDYMRLQLPVFQQAQSPSQRAYFAYQAQAWLHYAKRENSIDGDSAAGADALHRGRTILQALQNGNTHSLTLTSDIPKTSRLMRPDLWATLNALKAHGGITAAPKAVAFSEVALIWAGADYCKYGADASSAPFKMADDWLQQAREAYVQTHDSTSNVQLEGLINAYYKQYAPLASTDNECAAQTLPLNISTQNLNTHINNTLTLPANIIIQMLTPTVTYRIID